MTIDRGQVIFTWLTQRTIWTSWSFIETAKPLLSPSCQFEGATARHSFPSTFNTQMSTGLWNANLQSIFMELIIQLSEDLKGLKLLGPLTIWSLRSRPVWQWGANDHQIRRQNNGKSHYGARWGHTGLGLMPFPWRLYFCNRIVHCPNSFYLEQNSLKKT